MKVVLDDVEQQPAAHKGWLSQADRDARERRVLWVFALVIALPGLAGFLLAVFS